MFIWPHTWSIEIVIDHVRCNCEQSFVSCLCDCIHVDIWISINTTWMMVHIINRLLRIINMSSACANGWMSPNNSTYPQISQVLLSSSLFGTCPFLYRWPNNRAYYLVPTEAKKKSWTYTKWQHDKFSTRSFLLIILLMLSISMFILISLSLFYELFEIDVSSYAFGTACISYLAIVYRVFLFTAAVYSIVKHGSCFKMWALGSMIVIFNFWALLISWGNFVRSCINPKFYSVYVLSFLTKVI
mgnify:CR=1 FL=1